MTQGDRFLSPAEVAKRYGLSVAWVYRCVDLQKIKVRIGRYIRYRESDLEKFEAQRSTANRGFDLEHKKQVMRQTDIQQRAESLKQHLKKGKFRLKFDLE